MKPLMATMIGLVLVGALPVTNWAQTVNTTASSQVETTPAQVSYGVGSVFGTLVYAPFKATFCILGSIASVSRRSPSALRRQARS